MEEMKCPTGLFGVIDNKKIHVEKSGNKIFFPQSEVFWKNDLGIIADGYIVIDSIDDSTIHSESTLKSLLQQYKDGGLKSLIRFLDTKITGGAFNIALIDQKKGEIILINDIFGYYPLYYSLQDNDFYFSSVLKPIVDSLGKKQIDFLYLSNFFHFPYVPGNITPFKNIKILPPGSYLKYNMKQKTLDLTCYDNLIHKTKTRTESMSFYGKKIFDALNNACNSLYSENNKYALALSGGLDSRLLLASWPGKESLECVSWGRSKDILDIQIPQRLCKKFNAHHKIKINKQASFDKFMAFLKKVDNPLNAYGISELSPSQLNKIWMNGQFGELIGGEFLWVIDNPLKAFSNVIFPIPKVLHEGNIKSVGKMLFDSINRIPTNISRNVMSDDLFSKLKSEDDIISYISSLLDRDCQYLQECVELFQIKQRIRIWHFQRNLPINRCNRETIVPMTNYSFVRLTLSIPLKYRFNFRFMYYFYRNFFPEICKIRATKNKFPLDAPYQLQKFFMGWEQVKWRYMKPIKQKVLKKNIIPSIPEGLDYDFRANEDLLVQNWSIGL